MNINFKPKNKFKLNLLVRENKTTTKKNRLQNFAEKKEKKGACFCSHT